MKKVTLVYIKGAEVGIRKNQTYPLGIMMIQKYAQKVLSESNDYCQIDLQTFDYLEADEYVVKQIWQIKSDMVIFSSYIWNISRNLDIARKLKLTSPECLIGLGGPEAWDGNQLLQDHDFLDFILRGEGEISFVSSIKRFLLNNETIVLNGVFYRSESNIINTGEAKLIENLDELPALWDEQMIINSKVILFETSRGCPFQCGYCNWSSKNMRYYSLERIEADLKRVFEMEGIEQIFFIDSELDINIERTKEIMRLISKYNKRMIAVQGFMGFHKIDEELLVLCKDAKFKFGIGIQTTNPLALSDCGRQWFSKEIFEEKLKIITKYYPLSELEFQFIIGLPGDKLTTFKENLKWFEKIGGERITANRLFILPGSSFYKNAEQLKIKYDRKPFHLIYSNYTYSYEDIIASEAYWVAFQISRKLFNSKKMLSNGDYILEKDMFTDSLSNEILDKGLCFDGRQESQTAQLEYVYEECIQSVITQLELDKKGLAEYLKLQYLNLKAHRHFSSIKPQKTAASGSDELVHIDYYFMTEYACVQPGTTHQVEVDNSKIIVLLYDYKEKQIKKIVMARALDIPLKEILEKLHKGIHVSTLEQRQLPPIQIKIIDYMSQHNLLAYKEIS